MSFSGSCCSVRSQAGLRSFQNAALKEYITLQGHPLKILFLSKIRLSGSKINTSYYQNQLIHPLVLSIFTFELKYKQLFKSELNSRPRKRKFLDISSLGSETEESLLHFISKQRRLSSIQQSKISFSVPSGKKQKHAWFGKKVHQARLKSGKRRTAYFHPIFSANVNKNNDTATNFLETKENNIDEISGCKNFDKSLTQSNPFCLLNPHLPKNSLSDHNNDLIVFGNTSFNTNPLSSYATGKPSCQKLEALNYFGNDCRRISESSNKRRYSQVSKKATNHLKVIAGNLPCVNNFWGREKLDKTPIELLDPPPRRIPRLRRGRQSAASSESFTAHKLSSVSAEFTHLKNKKGQTIGGYTNSLPFRKEFQINLKERSQNFSENLKTWLKTPSSPSEHRQAIDSRLCDFNSNANAATSNRAVTESFIDFCDLQTNILIQPGSTPKTFETSPHFVPFAYRKVENRREINFCRKNPTSVKIAGISSQIAQKRSILLPSSSNTSTQSGSVEHHSAVTCEDCDGNRRYRTAPVTSFNDRSVAHKSQFTSCQVSLGNKSIESHNLDQDIAASVRCLCRISTSEKSCTFCEPTRFGSLSFGKTPFLTSENKETSTESGPLKKIELTYKSCINCPRYTPKRFSKPSSGKLLLPTSFVLHKEAAEPTRNEQRKVGLNSISRFILRHSEDLQKSSFNNHHITEEERSFIKRDHLSSIKRYREKTDLSFADIQNPLIQPKTTFIFNKLFHAAKAASPRQSTLGIITPEQTDMGCFHSVSNKAKVGPCRTNIYSDVQATIDQSPTVIEEYSPIVLRYRTPYFRAYAQVIMPPIRRKETWTVGWIQACDYMKFINQYGNLGCSSWEIPALKSGKIPAVSDSDGVSYPWYGNTTEIATIVGPTDTYRRMNLTMNDNFYPSVTWDVPVSEGTNAHLTRIVRDQSFITWLAAINETTKDIIVLKTVRWNFYLEIDIDPTRELGQRARIVAPCIQKQPLITNGPGEKGCFNSPQRHRRREATTDNNSNSTYVGQIPISALIRPSANNAQTLIWRPTASHPVVVVPAKENHRDSTELVLFNGCSAMHGKESFIKEISKQEVIQLQQLTR